MKVLKKIWVPVLIAIILIAFGGAVYYQKAVVPKKEIDKKAGITSGKLDDYITLGEYKGLSCEVTQDDIDESIKEETQTYTEVDREAKEGDCVEITYTGYVDGEKDKNISQSNCELYVGQEESLYAEFTNAVVGHKAGDKVEYQAKDTDDINYVAEKDSDYTGKNVKFTLKLVSVSEEETEDVTDKWVKDNYNEDYGISTVKEFYKWNEDYVLENKKSDLWQSAVDNATMNGYPQEMYDSVKEEFDSDAAYYADSYGITVDEYLYDFSGYTEESLQEEYLNEVKSNLVMWKIVEKENLTASSSEIEDKYEELYADCGYDNVEEMKKDYTDKEIEEAVLLDKAMDVVYDNANITKSYSLPK
ncbi:MULTISPECIES: FKBP-type peptidyl-prolyl cis-trans isomerase [Eubacterium]|uniref:FKBP-type peptidyl-prolyl cis-trans isomerase n=1 Tax=Eubacterium album TaxID=2978477 RepID=A0ABT2M0V2_9FIRM|nr:MULTISPECIES: FKBP-type peptidyl-prolyl cis-trans isomerase [unclassified Eubacterium (in: firmicutes)]MCT7399156.1 FKBP-type peptidyl-prolyl cis-trans isomerase [Eubacterium sp. LFL-14]MEE0293415.1 FKBP-type peptidyl-prolyl cis-trans isomerase [Eubacterium sp.]RGG66114.1 trigger factor [Eubacterium sp. AF17-7]RHR34543.1 trigger factor [Eubacterium sp. AF19-12LB]